jgi:hypothetical protein
LTFSGDVVVVVRGAQERWSGHYVLALYGRRLYDNADGSLRVWSG